MRLEPFDAVVRRHGPAVLRVCRAVPVAEPPDVPSALGLPGAADGDLWAALAALPDKQRRAVAYPPLAGLPYAEIAALVGGPPEAARRAAADGVAALRRTYRGDVS